MSSGSKNALEQLRNNYDWALKVADKELLFSKDIDSYKLAAFLLTSHGAESFRDASERHVGAGSCAALQREYGDDF